MHVGDYAEVIPIPSRYAISDCSTSGSITGGSEVIGSIAGYTYDSTVTSCTSTMTINGETDPPQVGWRAVVRTVIEGDKELEITEDTAEEVNLTVPAGVTGGRVSVEALLGEPAGGRVSATMPVALNIAEAFNDIAGHWAFNNINKLVSLGAIAAYPDGSFRPDSSITRAEFATVLAKAFKLAPQSGKIFTDTADH